MPQHSARVSGGDRLANALAQVSIGLRRGAELKVGFFEGAVYPDGTPVALVAAVQEFGASNARLGKIPPRPYFRPMVAAKSGEWPAKIGALLRGNGYDANATMQAMGLAIQGDLKQSIADVQSPPLSQVTLTLRETYALDGSLRSGKKGWPARLGARAVITAIRRVKAGLTSKLTGTAAKPLVWTGNLLHSVDYEVEEL